MPSVKLIATDLDGTLLDSEGKIPERNRAALAAARARGVNVTICTGRMFAATQRFAEQLGIDIPVICYNGAMLRHPDGAMLSHLPLEMEHARKLLAFFRARGLYVQSYIDDTLYVRDGEEKKYQFYQTHFGVTGRAVGDALYDPAAAPTKLLAVADSARDAEGLMHELQGAYGEEVYVTRSNADFVEMMNLRAGKASALATLAGSLGVAMDEVLAIGDGENDAGMIKSAGFGLAMRNARPRPKAVAREVVPSNDENGVAWAVEKYVL